MSFVSSSVEIIPPASNAMLNFRGKPYSSLPVLKDGNEHTWDAARYALAPLIRQGSRPRFSVT